MAAGYFQLQHLQSGAFEHKSIWLLVISSYKHPLSAVFESSLQYEGTMQSFTVLGL